MTGPRSGVLAQRATERSLRVAMLRFLLLHTHEWTSEIVERLQGEMRAPVAGERHDGPPVPQGDEVSGAVLSRTTSSSVIAARAPSSPSPWIASSSISTLRWPISSKSWRTVVSDGVR